LKRYAVVNLSDVISPSSLLVLPSCIDSDVKNNPFGTVNTILEDLRSEITEIRCSASLKQRAKNNETKEKEQEREAKKRRNFSKTVLSSTSLPGKMPHLTTNQFLEMARKRLEEVKRIEESENQKINEEKSREEKEIKLVKITQKQKKTTNQKKYKQSEENKIEGCATKNNQWKIAEDLSLAGMDTRERNPVGYPEVGHNKRKTFLDNETSETTNTKNNKQTKSSGPNNNQKQKEKKTQKSQPTPILKVGMVFLGAPRR
jgi:hypothetical protein